MSDQSIICYCFGVTHDQVRRHFRDADATLGQLIDKTQITRKCTACALDLDMLLDELQAERMGKVRAAGLEVAACGIPVKVDRVDSGFLLNRNGVQTSIRLANYPPISEPASLCTSHRWQVWLFDDEGLRCGSMSGRIGVEEELTIPLAGIPGCPGQGWFLLRQIPDGDGHYGTLRPQAVLEGDSWAAAYHTQFHTDASREGRRAGTPVFACDGRTRMLISVINGSSQPTSVAMHLEGQGFNGRHEFSLPGNGARMMEIDRAFPNLSGTGAMILRLKSSMPTRKNFINMHPDGSLGVDHFPNVV